MRILHLLHVFPPENRGGTESYAETIARAQRALGLDARVITGSEDPSVTAPREETDETGLPILRLPPNSTTRGSDWRCPATREHLARVFAGSPGALVHLHHWHNLVSDALCCAREHGLRSVVTLHDFFASCPLFFRVRADWSACDASVRGETCVRCVATAMAHTPDDVRPHYLKRQSAFRTDLEAADARLTVSTSAAALLRKTEVFEGLELEALPLYGAKIQATGAWQPSPDGRLRLISWGGLARGKGLHLLVEAVRRLEDPDAVEIHHHGSIVDAAYADELRDRGQGLRLFLHGRFDPDEMKRRFADHDVAIFPSLYMETYGLVVDEAMQLGLPVLVSDRGEPKERVGAKGRVFPANDPAALAAVLEELLADPSALAALRAAPAPEPMGLKEHLTALHAVYERVTEGPTA